MESHRAASVQLTSTSAKQVRQGVCLGKVLFLFSRYGAFSIRGPSASLDFLEGEIMELFIQIIYVAIKIMELSILFLQCKSTQQCDHNNNKFPMHLHYTTST